MRMTIENICEGVPVTGIEWAAIAAVVVISAVFVAVTVRRSATAERAEEEHDRESRIQLELMNQLLIEDDIEDALPAAAGALRDIFGFGGCELSARAERGRAGDLDDANANVHARAGVIELRAQSRVALDDGDQALLQALVGSVATAVDRLRLRDEVREARLAAEIGRQRGGFLSAVSHNLRTPLTAVKAAATTLLASWSRIEPEERRELLETIADEAERLERLVRNTLELSRIRAGALDVHRQPVDLADRVRLDVGDDLPEVWLDVTMLEQILLNLLENALRFAPPGSEILVSVCAVDADHVELRVADHGPGVPPAACERIFDEFQSADDRPDHGGTGLGLAIVRALVRAHEGTVRCEETPGGGATFVCTFPRGEP
jgi:two-component system sensor histidine kinase KdpD